MKKSLFFVAAAALALTACTSENDILETGPTKQATPQAVGFDVYTPGATETRAGLEGTMTTNRMQRSETDGGGFGVYAYLTEDKVPAAGEAKATAYTGGVPNFMVNEKILWNPTSLGWYYNPLKYWPNETDKDSQTTPAAMTGDGTNTELDRLTFFAYAPYVAAGAAPTGITAITDKNGELKSTAVTDPTIAWVASETPTTDFNPNQGVDLLWGVAPSGGLSYTAVNGWTVTRNEGTPLLNMIKPNVNTSMKFLFQHALARFGVTVVAAVDQVAPGGKLDPNTKITIDNVTISGLFGTQGELNLNNGVNANIANWTKIQDDDVNDATTTISSTQSIKVAANATNNAIAQNLRWSGPHDNPVAQPVVGVTTAKQDLLAPSTKWYNKLAAAPAYNPAKVYYTDEAGNSPAVAKYTTTKKGECYTSTTTGKYDVVDAGTAINAPVYPNYNYNLDSEYYRVSEIKSYNGNNIWAYSFESCPTADVNTTWGSGKVKIVSQTTTQTTVEVIENSTDPSYIGKKFVVNATDLTGGTTLPLFEEDGTTATGISAKNITALYGYSDADLAPDAKVYWKRNNGSTTNPIWWYDYKGTKSDVSWDKSNTYTYVTLSGSKINVNDFNYAYDTTGDYYEAERNYLYVVPTNNVAKNPSAKVDDLRTIKVQIEYYITTTDDKLANGFAQTKNVVTKEVVLPSLANGKSYNLNLVLGLTSVKIEAEVDDWKVENVQADLPQNTAE